MKINTITYIGLLLIAVTAAFAAEDGGYAGSFLQLSVEARPGAMGNAYLGVSDDPAGQLFNPAGITGIRMKTFSSAYRAMTLDRQLGFVSFVVPTRLESSLGISWLYAGYGEVTARNRSGQELGRTISSGEHVFSVTFAKQFTPYMGLGAKLNYYHKKLANISANSVGFDMGGMLYIDSLFEYGYMEDKVVTDFQIGLAIKNLAAIYPWTTNDYWEQYSDNGGISQDDKFPISVGLGVSFRSFNKKLLMAFDAEKNEKQDIKAHFGGEYLLDKMFFLRAGLSGVQPTAGIGLAHQINNITLQFDYGFSVEKTDEGSDHILSLRAVF